MIGACTAADTSQATPPTKAMRYPYQGARDALICLYLKGLQVGIVRSTGGREDVGLPVFANEADIGEIELRVNGGKLIQPKDVRFDAITNFDPAMLHLWLEEFNNELKMIWDLRSDRSRELEVIEVARDVRLFSSFQIAIREDQKNYLSAKQTLNALVEAYPRARGILNDFSVARAAGYLLKFYDLFPSYFLQGDVRYPAEFDNYVLWACRKFWEAPEEAEAGQGRPKRLFPPGVDISSLARNYSKDISGVSVYLFRKAWDQPQVLRSVAQIGELRYLSPVFACIPDDPPQKLEMVGRVWQVPRILFCKDIEDAERLMYGRLAVVTDRWLPVIRRYYGGSVPDDMLPRPPVLPDIPAYGSEIFREASLNFLRNKVTYESYLKKCLPFSPNALPIFLLTHLKLNMSNDRRFQHYVRIIYECLEQDDFRISAEDIQGDQSLSAVVRDADALQQAEDSGEDAENSGEDE